MASKMYRASVLNWSALARPQNTAAYGDPDVADLAAAYAYGLGSGPPIRCGQRVSPSVRSC